MYTQFLRILQWKAAIQVLIHVDFDVGFLLEHLQEIARVFFKQRVQPTVDIIDTYIESFKKEIANLEARHGRLLFSVTAFDRFQGKTLITGL